MNFKSTWETWVNYRKAEKKKPLTPTTINLQLKKLEKFPVVKAIEMLNYAMEKGWEGFFEIKENGITKPEIIVNHANTKLSGIANSKLELYDNA